MLYAILLSISNSSEDSNFSIASPIHVTVCVIEYSYLHVWEVVSHSVGCHSTVLLVSFKHRIFNIWWNPMYLFSFIACPLMPFLKRLGQPNIIKIYSSFILSVLEFYHLHLGPFWVNFVLRKGSNFSHVHVDIQLPSILCPFNGLSTLIKNQLVDHKCRGLFLDIQFYWPICLSIYQCYTVLIVIAL